MTEKVRYERLPIASPELLVACLEEVTAAGKTIVIITDFDETVSQYGPSNGENPFDTRLHPQSGQALAKIGQSGGIIGVISNRSGRQIDQRYKAQGISASFIVGTYGMEIYLPSSSPNQEGESFVDSRFAEYMPQITKITGELYESISSVGTSFLKYNVEEGTLETPFGPVHVIKKAVSSTFPCGLSLTFNLNEVHPDARAQMVRELEERMAYAVEELLGSGDNAIEDLLQIWGITHDDKDPGLLGRYSWGVEPHIKHGKGYGIARLLKAVREKSIGLVIYAGDSNADGIAMQAGRLAEIFSKGAVQTANIWVKSDVTQTAVQQESDFSVEGVDGFSEVLTSLSNSMKAK